MENLIYLAMSMLRFKPYHFSETTRMDVIENIEKHNREKKNQSGAWIKSGCIEKSKLKTTTKLSYTGERKSMIHTE